LFSFSSLFFWFLIQAIGSATLRWSLPAMDIPPPPTFPLKGTPENAQDIQNTQIFYEKICDNHLSFVWAE
jgi:hypothetical protein